MTVANDCYINVYPQAREIVPVFAHGLHSERASPQSDDVEPNNRLDVESSWAHLQFDSKNND